VTVPAEPPERRQGVGQVRRLAVGGHPEPPDQPRQLLAGLERERVEEVVELDRQLLGGRGEAPAVGDGRAGAVGDLEVGLLDERLGPEDDGGALVQGGGVAADLHLHVDAGIGALESPDLAHCYPGDADLGVVDQVLRVGQRRRHRVAAGDAGDGAAEVDPQHGEDHRHRREEGGQRRSPGPAQESG
jgi:hypothetical protein